MVIAEKYSSEKRCPHELLCHVFHSQSSIL